MKEVRVKFSTEEFERLKERAEYLGLSTKELVHICAMGEAPEDTPLCATQLVCREISEYRQALNRIIQRETQAEIRLFEDDIIALEISLSGLERVVAEFVREQSKAVRKSGNIDI